MMTLEEAIKHCKKVAISCSKSNRECALDHVQLMQWLKELRAMRKHSKNWSEDDEHRVKDIIYFLDTAKKHYASTVELEACIDWLKSLKQRIGG